MGRRGDNDMKKMNGVEDGIDAKAETKLPAVEGQGNDKMES